MRTFNIFLIGDDLSEIESPLGEHLNQTQPAWNLIFARTGDEARALSDARVPDAVVLDLALSPIEDIGLELLAHLRGRFPTAPFVLLAPSGNARLLKKAFAQEGELEGAPMATLDPDAVLFSDDMRAAGAFDVLEAQISAGLYRCGRVSNETGILITHGTDTMAWGFAYLHYALSGLRANVAITGSQIPLGGYFTESDALGNLRTAVTLLNRLRPARLFAVFNEGRSVFSGRLTKYRKWDTDAFEGRIIASASSGEEVRPLRKSWVDIPFPDQRLSHLHLLRTGGTIESQRDGTEAGGLKPTGDFVWKYLTGSLGDHFAEATRHDLFALDSSNMSCEQWAQIARAIEALGVARADTRFDPSVKPVFCNPLFTTLDYRAQFAACGAGAVLAGFGGGNANVRKGSPHSILPALRASVKAGTFVAVTSQVPLEPYDAEYETGLALLEAGGVPCGDLPLADAQIKLSYLLGHSGAIAAKAREMGVEERGLLVAAFLSGVTMRRTGSLSAFRDAKGRVVPVRVLPRDPFVIHPFDKALDAVAAALAQ